MTHRRWQNGAEEGAFGPMELQVAAELATLGWNPGQISDAFGTLGQQAITLAETMDRTQDARSLAQLDNTLTVRMDQVREAAVGRGTEHVDPDSVDEFTRRRHGRAAPPDQGGAATGD